MSGARGRDHQVFRAAPMRLNFGDRATAAMRRGKGRMERIRAVVRQGAIKSGGLGMRGVVGVCGICTGTRSGRRGERLRKCSPIRRRRRCGGSVEHGDSAGRELGSSDEAARR
jgi:hypothetical protein